MKREKPLFFNRNFVSLLMAFSFIGLALSGIVMYVAPPCSVANAINWKILALSKDQWASLHQITALTFLVLAVFHLFVYNWRTFKCYWRQRKNRRRTGQDETEKGLLSPLILPLEVFTALIVAIILFVGAVSFIPPFGWLHDGSEAIEERHRQEAPAGTGRGIGSGVSNERGLGTGEEYGAGQEQDSGEGRGMGQGLDSGQGRGSGEGGGD